MAKSIDWSDIDKVKFFSIGTGVYSVINICLHPITVIKTRQQILLEKNKAGKAGSSKVLNKQLSLYNVIRDLLSSSTFRSDLSCSVDKRHRISILNTRNLFKGLGIVLAVAVPARAIYLGVLESSKERIKQILMTEKHRENENSMSCNRVKIIADGTISSISSGIAGGLASISAQALTVPMDVISQRQMVMGTSYGSKINEPDKASARSVIRSILNNEGWVGLYRGFGMSIFTSLPGGTIWWATYGGCQYELSRLLVGFNVDKVDGNNSGTLMWKGPVQLASSVFAAITTTTITQPLDVVKTKLQVEKFDYGLVRKPFPNRALVSRGLKNEFTKRLPPTAFYIARRVMITSGIKGFYSGIIPRVIHMTLWGTILSSAYEYLKYISIKA